MNVFYKLDLAYWYTPWFFIPKLGLEVVVLIFYLFSLLFSFYFLIIF